jgi:hypothetical protein
LVGLFVAMFYQATSGSTIVGIILMMILMVVCIFTTWWYKKIIMNNIYNAILNERKNTQDSA